MRRVLEELNVTHHEPYRALVSQRRGRTDRARHRQQPAGKDMSNAVSKTIGDLRDRGGLKGVDVANITKVSKATVTRWSAGTHSPQPKTQLVLSDLRYVVDKLTEFYTRDEIRMWLNARNDLLDGQRAIDLIHDGRTEVVLEAIERLGDMAYL
jgi:DNA-binding transcriptional regulator YiaG